MLPRKILLLAVAILVTPMVAPAGGAHPYPVPAPDLGPCNASEPSHHYVTGTSLDVGNSALPTVTWRTTVLLFDSCAFIDGEGDFGVGGGFLPTNHHGINGAGVWSGEVCVEDDVYGFDVEFVVGVSPGGGVINEVAHGTGCIYVSLPSFYPQPAPNPPSPGADGGIWVFLENTVGDPNAATQINLDPSNVSATAKVAPGVVVPTTGHIYTQ